MPIMPDGSWMRRANDDREEMKIVKERYTLDHEDTGHSARGTERDSGRSPIISILKVFGIAALATILVVFFVIILKTLGTL